MLSKRKDREVMKSSIKEEEKNSKPNWHKN